MREILFRGKNNGRWVYGSLVHTENEFVIIPEDATRLYGAEYDWGYVVDPETVGQFTGLKDKNGTRIFEGDIVDASATWWDAAGPAGHETPILEVAYDLDVCGFYPFANYDCDCGVFINGPKVVVIGNVHDNPEIEVEQREDD